MAAMEMSEEAFFEGSPEASAIHRAVKRLVDRLGPAQIRASRSQIGFYRDRLFASTWMPGRYLRGPVSPLVLSVYLRRRDPSTRWKEVVEPASGRFTHHLELHAVTDVDGFVEGVLEEAWREAAQA